MSKYIQVACVVCGKPVWQVDAPLAYRRSRQTCGDACEFKQRALISYPRIGIKERG